MYQEYPKWLYPENGAPVLVQDAEEEAALSGTPEPDADPAPAPAADEAIPHAVSEIPHAVSEPVKRGPGRPRKVP